MLLNYKVIKKWQPPPPPPFLHQLPFSGLSPLSSKKLRTLPSDSIFGRSYPPKNSFKQILSDRMYTLIHFDSRLLLILVTKNTNIWHLKLLATTYLIQKSPKGQIPVQQLFSVYQKFYLMLDME